jgi:hypothetical protein
MQQLLRSRSRASLAVVSAILVLFVTGLSGCRSDNAEGPSPFLMEPERAGYVADFDQMKKDEKLPFQKVWIDPDHVRRPRKVFIAQIDTDHIINKPWFSQVNTRYAIADYQKDLADIAEYTRTAIIDSFLADKTNAYPIVYSRAEAEVIIELSLVELIPASPELVAAGYIVPGPSVLNQPSVGFEGRVRVMPENKVVMTVAFRDKPETAIIDLQSMKSWYDADKLVIRKWAKLIVEVANNRYDPKNRSRIPVTLLSW